MKQVLTINQVQVSFYFAIAVRPTSVLHAAAHLMPCIVIYNILSRYVCQVTTFHPLTIYQVREVHLYTISFYFQEKELEGAQESGNVNVVAKEIDKLQTDKREVDNELRRLREEQQAMHMQSTTQAKLDMLSGQRKEQQRGCYSENVREINPFV